MPIENRSTMVSVPRDEVERLVKLLAYQAHPYPSPHAEYWQGILDAPAQQQGEPVVSQCPLCCQTHEQVPVGRAGGQQANGCDVDFTTWRCEGCGGSWTGDPADPGEVERLREENIRLIEDRARFPDRPDDIGTMIGCHIGNLKNQAKSSEDYARKWRWELEAVSRKLDAANALLQEFCDRVDRGEVRSNKSYAKFKAHLSASAERNQCDGCQAGIPLVNGKHRMGKPGQYADTMSCQAGRYASAEPSAPKCGNCGSGTGQACNDMGCGYLESGNGEPTAPVERDERADFEAHMRRDFPGVYLTKALDRESYRNPSHKGAWLSWQARAALERKP